MPIVLVKFEIRERPTVGTELPIRSHPYHHIENADTGSYTYLVPRLNILKAHQRSDWAIRSQFKDHGPIALVHA